MGRTCTICVHPERDAIDHAIVSGTSYRNVRERWHVSLSSISRHRRDHISPALVALRAQQDEAHTASLLERVEDLIGRTERILLATEQDGKVTTALAAVRELRSLLELLGKASGELDDRPQLTVNVLASPEWLAVRAAIFAALDSHPDARAAVAGRLLELGPG